jgi:hypothetical protein
MIATCPKCNKEFENNTGKIFCSRSCANSRIQTKQANDARRITNKKVLFCSFCNKTCGSEGALSLHERSCVDNLLRVPGTFYGRKHSEASKKKQSTYKLTLDKFPETIYNVSSRTKSKVIERLNKGCSNCGWNEAICDLHHIIAKSNGGSDSHDNLALICPNCHRLAHTGKLTSFISLQDYIGEEWKQFYYSCIV